METVGVRQFSDPVTSSSVFGSTSTVSLAVVRPRGKKRVCCYFWCRLLLQIWCCAVSATIMLAWTWMTENWWRGCFRRDTSLYSVSSLFPGAWFSKNLMTDLRKTYEKVWHTKKLGWACDYQKILQKSYKKLRTKLCKTYEKNLRWHYRYLTKT